MDNQRLLLFCELETHKRAFKKEARLFKEFLFQQGFYELHPGVYTRMVDSRKSRDAHVARLKDRIPSAGKVRLIMLTENQFQNSELLCGDEDRQELIGADLDIFI